MRLNKLIASRGCLAIFFLILLFLPSFSRLALQKPKVLAVREMSLLNRQPNAWVNGIFKDNILLTFAYARKKIKNPRDINWKEVDKPFTHTTILLSNETFAFHDSVLPQYKGKVVSNMNAHFNYQEGFKYDGYIVGDGVCHLASLLYWTARDAKLNVYAPTNHDFAEIADIPKEFGVSILHIPGQEYSSAQQNVYLTNNRNNPIQITFIYNGKIVQVIISE